MYTVYCKWYKVSQIPSYTVTKVARQTGRQTNIQPHIIKIIASCSVTYKQKPLVFSSTYVAMKRATVQYLDYVIISLNNVFLCTPVRGRPDEKVVYIFRYLASRMKSGLVLVTRFMASRMKSVLVSSYSGMWQAEWSSYSATWPAGWSSYSGTWQAG